VQVIWPKACLSENISFLVPMIKDKSHNIFNVKPFEYYEEIKKLNMAIFPSSAL
jgi:hypothetical protein